MDEEKLERMVDRFLTWQLPEDFYPDGGINYDPPSDESMGTKSYKPKRHVFVGTNLFTADQTREMILHILGEDAP